MNNNEQAVTAVKSKTKHLTALKGQMVDVIDSLSHKHDVEKLIPLLSLLQSLEQSITNINSIDFQSWNNLAVTETKHKLGFDKITITQKLYFLFNRIHIESAYISSLNKSFAYSLKMNKEDNKKLNNMRLYSIEKKKLFAVSLKLLLQENLEMNTTGMPLEMITGLLLDNLDNGIMSIYDYIYKECTVCMHNHDTCQYDSGPFCFCKLKSLNINESQHYSGVIKFRFYSFMGMYTSDYLKKILQSNAPRLAENAFKCENNTQIKRRCEVVVKEQIMYTDWTADSLFIAGEFNIYNAKEIEVQVWENSKEIGESKHLVAVAVVSLQALIENKNYPNPINISMEPEGFMTGEIKFTPIKKSHYSENSDLNKENRPISRKIGVKRRMNIMAKLTGYRVARHVEAHVPVSLWVDWFQNHVDRLAIPIDGNMNVPQQKGNKSFGLNNKKISITPCKSPLMNKSANESYRQISKSPMPNRVIPPPKFNQTNPRAICRFNHAKEIRFAEHDSISVINEASVCPQEFAISTPVKNNSSTSNSKTPFFEAKSNNLDNLMSPIHPLNYKILQRSTKYYNEKIHSKINEYLKTTAGFMADCSLTRSNIDLTNFKELDSTHRLAKCDSMKYSKTKLDDSDEPTDIRQTTIFNKEILLTPFRLDSQLDYIPSNPNKCDSSNMSMSTQSKHNNNLSKASRKSNLSADKCVHHDWDSCCYDDSSYLSDKSIIGDSYKDGIDIGHSESLPRNIQNYEDDEDDFDRVNGNGDNDVEIGKYEGNDRFVDADNEDFEIDDNSFGGEFRSQYICPQVLAQFDLLKVLGQGHFGKVLLAQMINTERVCAIKSIQKVRAATDTEYDSLFAERDILILIRKHNNPFLINLIGCFQSERHLFFALEYVAGGDFMGHVHKNPFREADARFYTSCVVLAFEFLHDQDIIYRDLKLDNVLMDKFGYAKLTDFGLSKPNMKWNTKTTTFCGTPEFLAPEIIEEQSYSRVIDWWALGVLLFELIVGESPFPGDDDREIFSMILSITPNCKSLSPEATSLIKRLLKRIPENRLGHGIDGTQKVKAHPFFASIDWDKLYTRQIPAPFTPQLESITDTQYFESEFTDQKVTIIHDGEEPDQDLDFDDELFRNFDTDLQWN